MTVQNETEHSSKNEYHRSIRMTPVSHNKKFSRNDANNAVAVRKLENILIVSEWSSLNLNSSATAELSFTIRYPNIVIESLAGTY